MQPNEIINRYVAAVGEHLPTKSRADIQTELTSLLTEMLEARATAEGRPADQTMTAALLTEFGEPEAVARRYVPQRPLLSAASSATFVSVWKIIASLLVTIAIVSTVIALVNAPRDPQAIGALLWHALTDFLSGMLINIGILGTIFFLIERFQPRYMVHGDEKWDPLKLPAHTDVNRLDRSEVIFNVVFNVLLIAVLNFAPDWVRFFVIVPSGIQTFPLLGTGLTDFLLILNISFVIKIALYFYVSTQGRWTRVTRLAELGASLVSAIVVWVMLNNSASIAASPTVEPILKIVLTVSLVIVAVDFANNLYRLITKRWNDTSAQSIPSIPVPNGQH